MDYLLCFFVGMVLSFSVMMFVDSDAEYFYDTLKLGEKVCDKNGGLKKFDFIGNFTCKDGAVFYTGE